MKRLLLATSVFAAFSNPIAMGDMPGWHPSDKPSAPNPKKRAKVKAARKQRNRK